MTPEEQQEQLARVLNFIQSDAGLIALLRVSATRAIGFLTPEQIALIISTLGVP